MSAPKSQTVGSRGVGTLVGCFPLDLVFLAFEPDSLVEGLVLDHSEGCILPPRVIMMTEDGGTGVSGQQQDHGEVHSIIHRHNITYSQLKNQHEYKPPTNGRRRVIELESWENSPFGVGGGIPTARV